MDIGTALFLEKESTKDVHTYECQIIDQDDKHVYIDFPTHQETRETTKFSKGTTFKASYIGEDNAMYRFETKVLDQIILNIPTLAIKPPDDNIERIQRREFIRVKATLDIAVHFPNQSQSPFVTVTVDLSGGGLSFIIPEDKSLLKGQSVEIWIVLPLSSGSYEYIQLSAQVLRMRETEDFSRIASVNFSSISHKTEQMIMQFCFAKQREAHLK